MVVLRPPSGDFYNFLEWVEETGDQEFYFRGQASAAWGLTPSVGRPRRSGKPYSSSDEQRIFSDFCAFGAALIDGESILEKLAVAQHYCLPTRLLDWSSSPLVAAWFACENALHSHLPGAVFRLRPVGPLTVRQEFAPNPLTLLSVHPVVLVRVPYRINRLSAQQGIFSLHPSPTRDWNPDPRPHVFEKFTIPVAEKANYLLFLERFGIDRWGMMPDLDNLGLRLSRRYQED